MSIPVPALAAALLSAVIVFRAVRHPLRPALRALPPKRRALTGSPTTALWRVTGSPQGQTLAKVPSSQRVAFLDCVNR
jgi:hypothetical protein